MIELVRKSASATNGGELDSSITQVIPGAKTFSGAVNANIVGGFQRKTLSANFTAPATNATEITDLRFNGLTVGKRYRYTFTAYVITSGCHLYVSFGDGSNNTTFRYFRAFTPTSAYVYTEVFTASATTLKFYAGSDSGTGVIYMQDHNLLPSGFASFPKTTWAILEEVGGLDVVTTYT